MVRIWCVKLASIINPSNVLYSKNQADIALQKLRDRIKKKDQKQDELVGQIKKIIQDELKDKIATEQR